MVEGVGLGGVSWGWGIEGVGMGEGFMGLGEGFVGLDEGRRGRQRATMAVGRSAGH